MPLLDQFALLDSEVEGTDALYGKQWNYSLRCSLERVASVVPKHLGRDGWRQGYSKRGLTFTKPNGDWIMLFPSSRNADQTTVSYFKKDQPSALDGLTSFFTD